MAKTFTVKDVVCDYGIQDETGNITHALILNSRRNADLIAMILNSDYNHQIYELEMDAELQRLTDLNNRLENSYNTMFNSRENLRKTYEKEIYKLDAECNKLKCKNDKQLEALEYLVKLKRHKEKHGENNYYNYNKKFAWDKAMKIVDLRRK